LTTKDKLNRLTSLKEQAKTGGGKERIEQQQARGKLTARDRIDLLLDSGSFNELGVFITHRATEFGLAEQQHLGDAVVTGSGKVDGRQVFVYSQDFTVLGGSISEVVGQKVCQVMDMAISTGSPIIAIYDSGGARIQEGVDSLCGVGDMLLHNTLCSGVVPQISVVVGPSAGGAVYCPAITDFIFVVKGISQMYITGPDVVRAVTHEEMSHQELGGAEVHACKSGVAHFINDNEQECFKEVRRLLGFLPQNNMAELPELEPADLPDRTDDSLLNLIPDDPKKAYDMKKLIHSIADDGDFMEVHQHFAPNIIVGFTRLDGRPAGVIAQQPSYMAGVIDIDASVKAARFVRFCDLFNIPVVTLGDCPGYMIGSEQDWKGILRHGAKLLFAWADATVPLISVIVRKSYAGAHYGMLDKGIGADLVFAWPTARVTIVGAETAASVIFAREIRESQNPEETRNQRIAEYSETYENPYCAAERGYIDDIIMPSNTRKVINQTLDLIQDKNKDNRAFKAKPWRKYSNINL